MLVLRLGSNYHKTINGTFVSNSTTSNKKKFNLINCRCNSASHKNYKDTQSYLENIKNGAQIFLIGTAHISKKSAEEVKETIMHVKPDYVFVELCKIRAPSFGENTITNSDNNELKSKSGNILDDIKGLINGKTTLNAMFTIMLFKIIYGFLKVANFDAGLEFKVAIEEAKKINAKIIYGDRPQNITLDKLSNAMTISDWLKFLIPGPAFIEILRPINFRNLFYVEELVETIKDRKSTRDILKFIETYNPKFANVLLHERDDYMVKKLLKLKGRVVAVVGIAHLDGIERKWHDQQLIDLKSHLVED